MIEASSCKIIEEPYICGCDKYIDSMLSKLDKRIYDVTNPDTYLRKFITMINNELCEAYADLMYVKNDIYLDILVEEEAVIKGAHNGIDCLANWAVAEIISVGDTPGASDYIENVDFVRHPRGIQWEIPESPYGYGYGYGYGNPYGYGYGYANPYFPAGRKEPETCDTYYVTYKYGVRDERLYEIFGVLVQLRKFDFQTYPEYRQAIRSLIIAFLGGPTVENIKDALSIFHPRDKIIITEFFEQGWILNVSILYPKVDWDDPDVDTSDGTLLTSPTTGFFEFSVEFKDSETLTADERRVIEHILDLIKPAHTKVLVIYS